ncbi:aspartate/glutamate racemase family protein [Isachenkonia alkalipeptolytica]|uniref:Amino acid racemase n=1 Tax=Isachenkonia alkalipeptolytica TaxID=2565777 RepID=A0AA43XIY6_9CLOT|nr:amino acid racemase [Isachenkonia alkalipeptolytica]NBG87156.1 amino acid racemase [Isachenkonia alkalipeptolytica]
MKTIGILGGMGPEATLLLYRLIIDHTDAKSDQEHIPTLIYSNTRVPDRTRAILHQGEDPLPYLIQSAKVLREGGADIIGMPCNTAHHYFDRLTEEVEGDYVNMVELTYRRILNNDSRKKIVLFATAGTIETGIYDFSLRNKGIQVLSPKPKDQEVIMKMIYGQIKSGKRPIDLEEYQELLYRMEEEGFEAVILGCTELSYLHSMFKFPVNIEFINTLDLLAAELVKKAKQ